MDLYKLDSYYQLDTRVSPAFAEIIRSYNFFFNQERALKALLKLIDELSDSHNQAFISWHEYFNKANDNLYKKLKNIPTDRKRTYTIIFFSKEFSNLIAKLEHIVRLNQVNSKLEIVARYCIQSLTLIQRQMLLYFVVPSKNLRTTSKNTGFSSSNLEKTYHLLHVLYISKSTIFDNFLIWEKLNHYDYLNTSLSQLSSQLSGISIQDSRSVENFAKIDINDDVITFCMRQNADHLDHISNGEYNRALKPTIGRIQTIQTFMDGVKARVLEQYVDKIFPSGNFSQPAPDTVEYILYQGKMNELAEPFRVIILMCEDTGITASTPGGNLLKQKIQQYKIDVFQYDFRLYQTLERLKII